MDGRQPPMAGNGAMKILLYAPQDFNNLCMIARTLEVFGYPGCSVYDPNGLVRPRYGKRNRQRIASISAGAFGMVKLDRVEDPARFLADHTGRAIAAVTGDGGIPLPQLTFRDSDLVVFGSEVRGLPEEIVARCALRATIPQCGVTQSLNLAVAAGIFLYAARVERK